MVAAQALGVLMGDDGLDLDRIASIVRVAWLPSP
jgi:hypothetical protein